MEPIYIREYFVMNMPHIGVPKYLKASKHFLLLVYRENGLIKELPASSGAVAHCRILTNIASFATT